MENSVLKEKSVKCSRSIKILALACLVLSLVSLGVSCFEFVVHVNKLPRKTTAYQTFEFNHLTSAAVFNWSTVILSALLALYIFFFYEQMRANGVFALMFLVFFFISVIWGLWLIFFLVPRVNPYLLFYIYGPLFCFLGIGWSLKRFNKNKYKLAYSLVAYLFVAAWLWISQIYKAIRYDTYRPRYGFLAPVLYETVTYLFALASVAMLCFTIWRFLSTHTVFSVFLPKYSEWRRLNHRQAVACRKLDRMHESGLLNYQEYCAACDDVVEHYK